MAHEGIFATSHECISKLGDNYNSTAVNEEMINEFCRQSESYINVVTGYNWSDWYAGSPNTDVKYILTEASSNLVAIYGLNYKPSGEDGAMSRIEYEDRINILFARFVQCMDILTDLGTEKFIRDA